MNFPFEFYYRTNPLIDVQLNGPSGEELTTSAVFDTRAEVSLFDEAFAQALGIELGERTIIFGVGPEPIEARRGEIEILLLEEPALTVRLMISFAAGVFYSSGNLIGLDVLSHFDLALRHAIRTGYLRSAERA